MAFFERTTNSISDRFVRKLGAGIELLADPASTEFAQMPLPLTTVLKNVDALGVRIDLYHDFLLPLRAATASAILN